MELCTSTNIYYERENARPIPVEESIRLCAEAGYRQLDFCFVDQVFGKTAFLTEDWRPYVERLGTLAGGLGVAFVQSHGPIDDFWACPSEATLAYVHRSLEASALLGVRWMVVHPSGPAAAGSVALKVAQANRDYFRRLSDHAGRLGIGLAIENMWGVTAEKTPKYAIGPGELCSLCDTVDAENVGVCWDTEHAAIEGLDQSAALRQLGGRLKALHISDWTAPDNVHILPYTGRIGWGPVLAALGEIGFEGPFTYEMQHYLRSMPQGAVPAALRLSYAVGMEMIRQVES